ncbi:sterol desaturase family protein [Polynucleobacter sp. IMCC30063]|uniref:sterol desaturase family protein n=1 Tax=Polynucleobacter sp. IMCC30063 TaxID=2907298 RepID=UPI001F15F42B
MNEQLLNQIILIAIPIFSIFMLGEFFYGLAIAKNTYRLNDTISSISQGLLSQSILLCLVFFQIGAYELLYIYFGARSFTLFWESWYGWIIAFLIYDFIDYWLHRVSHQSALLWGSHVVHHQSQLFNFSTALRQESFFPIIACFFFAVMALLGIPPYQFVLIGLFVLIYQFWMHTEHIGKLGWFDSVFSSPSNHRVHHAINDEYIDKNFGAVLIIWDRIFGTYREEKSACIYGTQTPLNSWNPLWALGSVFINLYKKSRNYSGLITKLKIFFKGPTWRPNDEGVKDSEVVANVFQIYNPPLTGLQKWVAVIIFSVTILFSIYFFITVDQYAYFDKIMCLILVSIGLYYAGFFMGQKKQPT